jgi:hypothetical protein
MDEFNSKQVEAFPQIIEKPASVTVFGVMNIVVGCYHLVRLILLSYKMLMDALNYPEITTGLAIMVLLFPALNAGLWVWLFILGIGLLTMKRWARRGSIIFAWINIGWFIFAWSWNVVLVGCILMPEKRTFMITSMCKVLISLIYPVLLLIFMQTAKVKRAFHAREKILHLR